MGSQIVSQPAPSKLLVVYVNDTKVAQLNGIIENNTYTINVNNKSVGNLKLNSSSNGTIFNKTISNSSIQVVLEDSSSNSTNLFANDESIVKFLNIDI